MNDGMTEGYLTAEQIQRDRPSRFVISFRPWLPEYSREEKRRMGLIQLPTLVEEYVGPVRGRVFGDAVGGDAQEFARIMRESMTAALDPLAHTLTAEGLSNDREEEIRDNVECTNAKRDIAREAVHKAIAGLGGRLTAEQLDLATTALEREEGWDTESRVRRVAARRWRVAEDLAVEWSRQIGVHPCMHPDFNPLPETIRRGVVELSHNIRGYMSAEEILAANQGDPAPHETLLWMRRGGYKGICRADPRFAIALFDKADEAEQDFYDKRARQAFREAHIETERVALPKLHEVLLFSFVHAGTSADMRQMVRDRCISQLTRGGRPYSEEEARKLDAECAEVEARRDAKVAQMIAEEG